GPPPKKKKKTTKPPNPGGLKPNTRALTPPHKFLSPEHHPQQQKTKNKTFIINQRNQFLISEAKKKKKLFC
ncbi:hypothetical protein AAEJ42_21810, partial [Shewanella algae]|uniref:hypothetical protein n=1 Tax=Shewanella algae TaxID=38313 RepID=UPI00313D96BE